MRVTLKRTIGTEDVAEMRAIYHRLQQLTVGLHPSATGCVMLMACLAVVRQTLAEWTGDASATERQITPSKPGSHAL